MNTFKVLSRKVAALGAVVALLSVATLSFASSIAFGQAVLAANISMTTAADAPDGTSYLVSNTAIQSTGAGSTAAAGGVLTYHWAISNPPGGGAALIDSNTSLPATSASVNVQFNPLAVGTYTLSLYVKENGGAPSAAVTQNVVVVAAAGGGGGGGGAGTLAADINVLTAANASDGTSYLVNTTAIQSTGAGSTAAAGGVLTYHWAISNPPGGGAALIDTNTSLPATSASVNVQFNPLAVGTYTLSLYVKENAGAPSAAVTENVVVVAAGGGGTAVAGSVPYGMQGGGRCEDPAYCNIPWNATDHIAIRKREGVKGITLEKKVNTKRADTEEGAVSLGRETTTDVTYTVVIGNHTGYNVDKVVIEDIFKGGKVVRQSRIRSVEGASYDPINHLFTVNKTIQNGGVASFSYQATLISKSRNAIGSNTAVIKDVVFPAGVYERSADAKQGLSDSAYIKFGRGAVAQKSLEFGASTTNIYVPTEVTADTSEVKAGESVNYTITVRNNTDEPLTGVVVTDNYDEGLVAIKDAPGANNNGTDVSWAVGTVEAGETLRFTYTAVVREDAEYADTLLESKIRVYTDQYDDEAVASLDVHVAPKYAGFLAGAQRSLPATGLALLPILLGSLGVAVVTRKKKLVK